jgi:hypothetical protein
MDSSDPNVISPAADSYDAFWGPVKSMVSKVQEGVHGD